MGRVLGMKGGLGAPVRGGPKGCKEVQGDVRGVRRRDAADLRGLECVRGCTGM